jgi:hypothetical protein
MGEAAFGKDASGPEEARASIKPFSLWREDLITALLATAMIIGLFLDGWNHINLQNGALGSFFTIWHACLYTGFTATGAWVITRNPHLYLRGAAPKPEFHYLLGFQLRYPFAVLGIAIAMVGMGGDAIWHTVFGTERGVARVIAPFHLLLFSGACLLIAAPLRSAWHAPDEYPAESSFRKIVPPLISLTLVTALAAFMFQWLSAFLDWTPSIQIDRIPTGISHRDRIEGTVEFAGTARIVVTNLILMAPILLALRRWRLPFGSVTFVFTAVALGMAALTSLRLGGTVLAATIGGLVADTLIQWLRPSPARPLAYRIIAVLVPIGLWTAYFLVLIVGYDIHWPLDLWLGTTGLAGLTAIVLSTLAVPPAVGGSVWSEDAAPPLSITRPE